jgi:hypothetical protein
MSASTLPMPAQALPLPGQVRSRINAIDYHTPKKHITTARRPEDVSFQPLIWPWSFWRQSMSIRLRQYLIDAYVGHGEYNARRMKRDFSIQIDDQDDNDVLADFCNMFVTVGKRNTFEIEISGNFPITKDISDLAEIYGGFADAQSGRMVMRLSPANIEALNDLSLKIRATAQRGYEVDNPGWERISARTISSLRRFVRVIKEYQKLRRASMI